MYNLALQEANAKEFELDGERLNKLQADDKAWKDKEVYLKDIIKSRLEDGKKCHIYVYHLLCMCCDLFKILIKKNLCHWMVKCLT